jgi:hypothetical protein
MNTKIAKDCGHATDRIWTVDDKELCSECMLRIMNKDTYDEVFQGDEDEEEREAY